MATAILRSRQHPRGMDEGERLLGDLAFIRSQLRTAGVITGLRLWHLWRHVLRTSRVVRRQALSGRERRVLVHLWVRCSVWAVCSGASVVGQWECRWVVWVLSAHEDDQQHVEGD